MRLLFLLLGCLVVFVITVESRSRHRVARQSDEDEPVWWIFDDEPSTTTRRPASTRTTTTRRTPTTTTTRRTTTERMTRPTTTTTTSTSTELSITTSTLSPIIINCIRRCQSTQEYNPICGTNRQTYNNIGRLMCAKTCGQDVEILRRGTCEPA